MKTCVLKIDDELRYYFLPDVNGTSLRAQEESIKLFYRMNIEPFPNKRDSPHAILNRYRNSKD